MLLDKAHITDQLHKIWDAVKASGVLKTIYEWRIAGGCFVSLYHRENINDWDFICIGRPEFIGLVGKPQYQWQVNPYSCTMQLPGIGTINFIKQPSSGGNTRTILKGFDFMHTMVAWKPGSWWYPRNYVNQVENCIETKKLEYNTLSRNPVGALFRVAKFNTRGFVISNDSLASIVSHLHAISIADVRTHIGRMAAAGGAASGAIPNAATQRKALYCVANSKAKAKIADAARKDPLIHTEPNQQPDGTIGDTGRFL